MDVICLGILVADVFASPIDSLPQEGELKTTDRFLMSVGGCAANTAVDLRRLDRSVAALARVNTEKSAAALKEAAENGDRYLKKIARATV